MKYDSLNKKMLYNKLFLFDIVCKVLDKNDGDACVSFDGYYKRQTELK
jgi:hypothetical protein